MTRSNATPCGHCQRRNQSGLEKHLLVCSACRDRLTATEEYVVAMSAAAAAIRESGKGE
jgi:uncharacterized CHY-type Zn-finger protein